MMLNSPSNLPAASKPPFSPRVCLIDISTIRALRGCDAEKVLDSVADATHPKFLRWVFNVAVKPAGIRKLRFWRDEDGAIMLVESTKERLQRAFDATWAAQHPKRARVSV